MPKKKQFNRGYEVSRDKVKKSAMYSRSCFNCTFYYQAEGDNEEMCQNSNVLQYDMVVSENSVYCSYWRQNLPKEQNEHKNKYGREQLD